MSTESERSAIRTGLASVHLFLWLLLLIAIGMLWHPALAAGPPFSVDNTADAPDMTPGDDICAADITTDPGDTIISPGGDVAPGQCTLRAAIMETNAAVRFPVSEIILPPGIYRLTLGELQITESLFMRGDDAVTTIIDGNDASRVVNVVNTGGEPIVNISRVTIRNGRLGAGGGNVGVGLRVGLDTTVNLSDAIVEENEGRAPGAGIGNGGFLQLSRVTVRDNKVPIEGLVGGVQHSAGGIMNFNSAVLKIDRSTITSNEAKRGGGIRNAGGRVEITNSTISGNRATARGGGIMNFGILSISYSTITRNEANLTGVSTIGSEESFGGGIYNHGSVFIGNSILADNTDNRHESDPDSSPDCFSETVPGEDTARFTSFRGNLLGIENENCDLRDTIFGDDISFDIVGTAEAPVDPLLFGLADTGSLAETHAPRFDSPVIDEGTGITSASFFDCPATDQRGFERPIDGDGDGGAQCDIGAFEFDSAPRCRGQLATRFGTAGADFVLGSAGQDVIHGLDGHDTLRGLDGDDIICGGKGDDDITGDSGADVLIGQQGGDDLDGGDGEDELRGGSGKDILRGGGGSDFLHGADGDDIGRGGGGNDEVRGGAGDDRLFGGSGNDALIGGSGNDAVDGGGGTDTCAGEAISDCP